MSGFTAMIAIVQAAPRARLTQNRLVRSSSCRETLCTAADESPKSRTRSATPITAVTIARRPKSSGDSRRARTTTDANWSATRTPWAARVTPAPRAARVPRSADIVTGGILAIGVCRAAGAAALQVGRADGKDRDVEWQGYLSILRARW